MNPVRLHLLSNPEQVTTVPDWLQSTLATSRLDETEMLELRYAVIEVLNNCIEHAYELEPNQPIELICQAEQDFVCITIRDRGHPYPAIAPVTIDALTAESGRGLVIVEAWADAICHRRIEGWNVTRLARMIR